MFNKPFKFACHAKKHLLPVAERALTEQLQRWIPRRVVAPASQRQSEIVDRANQTGTASAPARWAVEVSAETTRSRSVMMAAVSANGTSASSASPRFVSGKHGGSRRDASSVFSFCKLMSCTPATAARGGQRADRKRPMPVSTILRTTLPGYADTKSSPRQPRSPLVYTGRLCAGTARSLELLPALS